MTMERHLMDFPDEDVTRVDLDPPDTGEVVLLYDPGKTETPLWEDWIAKNLLCGWRAGFRLESGEYEACSGEPLDPTHWAHLPTTEAGPVLRAFVKAADSN